MRGRTKVDTWPREFHGPGGERSLFSAQMYVPLNWTPYVQLHPEPIESIPTILPDRDHLRSLLKEKGIKIDPRWSITVMEQMLKEE